MTFRDLHHGDQPLLLPNAWDLGSAIAFVDAGFAAVGTTSFGVAGSAGTPDGGRSTKAANLELAQALRSLSAYVSIDIEDGYSDDPDAVASYVASLGVDGVNLEDSYDGALVDSSLVAAKVRAVKARTPDLFVNARVDNFWFGQDANVEATVARAQIYIRAGADGIFVPGNLDAGDLGQLAAAISVPLNVLVTPALTVSELGELGVRRVSTGSLPYRAAIDAAVGVARAARDQQPMVAATSYADMQARLNQFAHRTTTAE